MTPRLASGSLTLDSFARCVGHTTAANWERLPVQWRGFVINNWRFGHTAEVMLDQIDRGVSNGKLDPQGVFDAYNGICPQ